MTMNNILLRPTISTVVGRFAPSPTGQLHLGSLITAVASYCAVRQLGGKWLVRMEDVDTERCKPAFADSILADLERLGLHWDGDIRYQSQHLADYHEVIDNLANKNLVYGCDCSRKQIETFYQNHLTANPTYRYPRFCLAKHLRLANNAVRLVLPNSLMGFYDKLQGTQWCNPQLTDGDIVLQRSNGIINYMLAVVVDDMLQGITQIVRGLDILPLTLPQLALADYSDFDCVDEYYHLPILVNAKGQKLSKQTLAEPIADYNASKLLQVAFLLLDQPKIDLDTPERMLAQGVQQWDFSPLIGVKTKIIPASIEVL